jgi:hypothetical protein
MSDDQANTNNCDYKPRLTLGEDARRIGVQEIRPESSAVLGHIHVQAQFRAVTMQADGLASRQGGAEFRPSLSEPAFVHEDKVKSSLSPDQRTSETRIRMHGREYVSLPEAGFPP